VARRIDWDALRAAAVEAATHAYAPYSHFHVGRLGSSTTGASYGRQRGGTRLYGLGCAPSAGRAALRYRRRPHEGVVVNVAGDGAPVMPCGRCRQLLWEHGGPDCLVDGDGTPRPMSEILPGAFDESSMEGRLT
jgi:cytidine deaminase